MAGEVEGRMKPLARFSSSHSPRALSSSSDREYRDQMEVAGSASRYMERSYGAMRWKSICSCLGEGSQKIVELLRY